MKRLLLSLLLLIPSAALAWEDWDQSTRDSFARTTNWIVLDWHSTDMFAAEDWDGFRELNPVLGETPSREAVALYMLGRIGINYWIHDFGYGDNILYQGITIGHVFYAANNYKIRGDSDKIKHIAAGAIISETVSHYTGSRWKGCAAALGAGIVINDFDTVLGCSVIKFEF